MKRLLVILFILFSVLIFDSCRKIWPDDKFTIKRQNYNGNELKISGYYYNIYSVEDKQYYRIYFFYNNGIELDGGGCEESNIYQYEDDFISGKYYDNAKNYKNNWGLFEISGNKISFEQWETTNGRSKSYINSGEIINDSTFRITERYRLKRDKQKEYEILDAIYHFKQFSPKPDSTNSFIE